MFLFAIMLLSVQNLKVLFTLVITKKHEFEPNIRWKFLGYLEKNSYTSFKRFCKTLELKNDSDVIAGYKNAHSKGNTWPEITLGMREVGILDMEIYLLGTKLANKPRQNEWEAHMSKFRDMSPEATAEEKWQLLELIYKLDYIKFEHIT